jgi:hypothetical protein
VYLNRENVAEIGQPVVPPPTRQTGSWLLRRALRHLHKGRLTIVLPSGEQVDYRGSEGGADATIILHNSRALHRILTGGDVGFADGYVAGDWSSPDLVALISLCAENVTRLQRTMDGFLPVRLFNRIRHLLRGNSRARARKNIAFHYDLGNDFYRLWLDESMTYSSACASHPYETLEEAQQAKLDRIAHLLDLRGAERVLEIGCGWGALAANLADRCKSVTGLTLSHEQLVYARERCARTGTNKASSRSRCWRPWAKPIGLSILRRCAHGLPLAEQLCCRQSRSAKTVSTLTVTALISFKNIFFQAECCPRVPLSSNRRREQGCRWPGSRPFARAMQSHSLSGGAGSSRPARRWHVSVSILPFAGCGNIISVTARLVSGPARSMSACMF